MNRTSSWGQYLSMALSVVGIILGTALLVWVPLWQVVFFGYATIIATIATVILFLGLVLDKNVAGGLIGASVAAVVIALVLLFTGAIASNNDRVFRVKDNALIAVAQPEHSLTGAIYPGWWNKSLLIARNVAGKELLTFTLPQDGELNTLTLELTYVWSPSTYGADLLRGETVDYDGTDIKLKAAVAEVLGRYNENRSYREEELAALRQDIGVAFCARATEERADAACPDLRTTLTYKRNNQTTTLTSD